MNFAGLVNKLLSDRLAAARRDIRKREGKLHIFVAVALCRDRAAVHFYDRLADIKPQPRAFCIIAAGFVDLIKSFKDTRKLFGGDPRRARIANGNGSVFLCLLYRYADRTVFGELHRVIHKILYDLVTHTAVG